MMVPISFGSCFMSTCSPLSSSCYGVPHIFARPTSPSYTTIVLSGRWNRIGSRMRLHLRHALNRVQSLPNATAYLLARAFAFFFELINLAETNHRKRRRKSSRSLYAAPTTITRAASKPACSA